MDDFIIADLKDSYGITCNQISPVTGGWMNQKWRVSTDKGELLVKQFSYKRFNKDRLDAIEAALQRQIILEGCGVPCPKIHTYNGQAIRHLDSETAYMVMDFLPGKMEGPDTITIKQMRSLGSACGLMHKAFSQLPVHFAKGYPISSRMLIDALWTNFHTRKQECTPDTPIEYRNAVLALEPILKTLTEDFFDRLPKGIAHEDFSPDNMLFDADGISAIIDFDRNQYSFIWHDIGRAILSFALDDNKITLEKVDAFLEGYTQHLALTMGDISDSLRLSWCLETIWWIQPEFFGAKKAKVLRFKDEMLWLTDHWFEIDSISR